MNLINEKGAFYIMKYDYVKAYYENQPIPKSNNEYKLPKGYTINEQTFTKGFAAATPYAISKSRVAIEDCGEMTNIVVAHTLYVTDFEVALVLNPKGNRLVHRDETFISRLIKEEKDFWERYLLPQIPPSLKLAPEMETLVAERYKLHSQMKEIEKQLKAIDATIKDAMGQAEEAVCGNYKIFYKRFTKKVFNKDLVPPEIYQAALVDTETSRFEIKPL